MEFTYLTLLLLNSQPLRGWQKLTVDHSENKSRFLQCQQLVSSSSADARMLQAAPIPAATCCEPCLTTISVRSEGVKQAFGVTNGGLVVG